MIPDDASKPIDFAVFENTSTQRQELLGVVHKVMDADTSGYIEAAELMLLGQARRKLGHKKGEWTEEQNQTLVDKVDGSGTGRIIAADFAEHFDRILPGNREEFIQNIQQFMDVARLCTRDAGLETRDRKQEAKVKPDGAFKTSAVSGHLEQMSNKEIKVLFFVVSVVLH